MKKMKSDNIIRNYMIACIAVMLVLISSCNIKTSIKSMLGVPLTEHQSTTAKKSIFNYANTGTCLSMGTYDTSVTSQILGQSVSSLPVILLSPLFVFLFGFPLAADKPRPLYGSIKAPGSLPLFLQYRKLII